jgi:hypothetical protein
MDSCLEGSLPVCGGAEGSKYDSTFIFNKPRLFLLFFDSYLIPDSVN